MKDSEDLEEDECARVPQNVVLISPSYRDSLRLRLLKPRIFNPRSTLLRAFYKSQVQPKSTKASDT